MSPYGQAFELAASVTLPAAGQNLAVLRFDDEHDDTRELVSATFVSGQALFGIESGGI